MKANEIMTREVETVPESSSLKEVAEVMKRLNVGSLIVVNGKKVIGIVTDRDIVIRSTAMGHDPNEVPVKDIMSTEIVTVYHDQDMKDIARLMGDRQVRRLPVVDREMQLIGVISLGDLSVDGNEEELSGEALQKISSPSKPHR